MKWTRYEYLCCASESTCKVPDGQNYWPQIHVIVTVCYRNGHTWIITKSEYMNILFEIHVLQ